MSLSVFTRTSRWRAWIALLVLLKHGPCRAMARVFAMTRLVSSPRVVTQTPAAVMSNLLAVQAPPWRWLQCWMALGRPTRTYKLRGRSHSTSCVSRSIISTFSLNASLQSLPPVVGFVCNFQSFDSLATKLLPSLPAILISFQLSINENEVRYSRHNLRCDCLRSQP